MTTVSLDDLDSAMEWVSSDFVVNQAYVCRDSGKIYWISGDPGVLDEKVEAWHTFNNEQAVKALKEWCKEEGL